jgi:hypothetical protein
MLDRVDQMAADLARMEGHEAIAAMLEQGALGPLPPAGCCSLISFAAVFSFLFLPSRHDQRCILRLTRSRADLSSRVPG